MLTATETVWKSQTSRENFPVLNQRVHDKPLVYLDNAATTQKPQMVLDAMNRFYQSDNSNIHRGVHELSERSTLHYEQARVKIQEFLNAADWREIIFCRGATEGINLVAYTYGRRHVEAGDEIVISAMEHHSNIVPWQILCEEKKAILRIAPINQRGELLVDEYEKLLSPRTRLVSMVHVSNALGTVNPIAEIVRIAHAHGVPVFVDGAQAVAHLKVDVQALDCDFYALSGHKMFGPTGIGVLYGKAALLDKMPPYQGGGDMIRNVTFAKTTYNELPYKFEAGTPNIAGTIGLGAAVDYLNEIGLDRVAAYEHDLLAYATQQLERIPGLRIIGTAREKASVISFVLEGVHPHDVGTILDREGVAVRTGNHCAQPVLEWFGVPPPRALPSLSTTPGRISTRWSRASPRSRRFSTDAAGSLPGSDHRSQQAPAQLPPDGRCYTPRRGLQSAVRRQACAVREIEWRRGPGCQFRRRRLRHFHRVGIVDDREREGQIAPGGRRFDGALPRSVDHRKAAVGQAGKADRILRRARISGARQMRYAGLAYIEVGSDRRERNGVHRMRDKIITALRTVRDPEIPMNIWDMGLIYNVDVNGANEVHIRMTLTAPNCPVAGTLPGDVERAVRAVPGVKGVKLELVFDPPWDKSRMSEDARLLLGIEDGPPDLVPLDRLGRP